MRVVYFSPVHLHSFWQRPHWMAASLLRHGVDRLLWLEPYATRLPRLSDLRRPSDRPREMGTTAPLRLDRMAVRALPIEPLLAGRAANQLLFFEDILARIERWVGGEPYVIGVGKPSPLALTALDRAAGRDNYAGSFFDAMDRYGAFHKGASREAMSDWESQLLRKVDYVQASAPQAAGVPGTAPPRSGACPQRFRCRQHRARAARLRPPATARPPGVRLRGHHRLVV
jgi:hypothetical protein